MYHSIFKYLRKRYRPQQVGGNFLLIEPDFILLIIVHSATCTTFRCCPLFPDGPRFLTETVNPSADPGDSVSMTCEVDSNPPAAIAWRRKGSSRIISSQSILHIPTVTEEHFATFTCSASVYGKEEITRDVRVLRRGIPTLVSAVAASTTVRTYVWLCVYVCVCMCVCARSCV